MQPTPSPARRRTRSGGILAIEGIANIYGIGAFPGGGPPLLKVPLKLGSPSTIVTSGSGVTITTISAAWKAGTASVVTGTNGTVTAMGSNGLTPAGMGTLVLVTPVKVLSGIAGTVAGFGVLSLTYVPEPGTALLLGLGVVGIAALGRTRL